MTRTLVVVWSHPDGEMPDFAAWCGEQIDNDTEVVFHVDPVCVHRGTDDWCCMDCGASTMEVQA